MATQARQRPALQTRVNEAPHPSDGGRGDGYSQDMRALVMAIRDAGRSNDPLFEAMRQLHLYPSVDTERRWEGLENDLGHVRQCRRTGNRFASVFKDHNLLLLALYRIGLPSPKQLQLRRMLFCIIQTSVMSTFGFILPHRFPRLRGILV
jgi:hypothetical protein